MTLPHGIWALGLVSAFMDIASEMIHGLLPVFLVAVLGASATTVGLIEGAGEGLALIAFTQGLFSALVADSSIAEVRGTAFGVYGLATGLAVLLASVLAGGLWDCFGAPATFLAGALFSVLALAGFGLLSLISGSSPGCPGCRAGATPRAPR